MSGQRRLVLWRHGQTSWNLGERFQGQTDVPLDETGLAQAGRAARLLAALRPEVIVASDLRRAADTAATLGRVTDLPVAYDKDLRERYMGSWEGRTAADVRQRWPEAWQARQPHDGETLAEVAIRVEGALRRAAEAADGSVVVAVSHGSALRLGMVRLLGFPEELWNRVGALSNCSWSVLSEDRSGWRLVEHNAGTLPEPVLSDDR
ncbi:MAG: histidine phosphatase family protein [Streptosporangiales bacterium]|nr:histidine phosphatase family protein [Streptosporangiales bacterium]